MQLGEHRGGIQGHCLVHGSGPKHEKRRQKSHQKRNKTAPGAEIGDSHIFLLANDGFHVCPPEEEAHDHLTLLTEVDQAVVKFPYQVIHDPESPAILHEVVQLTVRCLCNKWLRQISRAHIQTMIRSGKRGPHMTYNQLHFEFICQLPSRLIVDGD